MPGRVEALHPRAHRRHPLHRAAHGGGELGIRHRQPPGGIDQREEVRRDQPLARGVEGQPHLLAEMLPQGVAAAPRGRRRRERSSPKSARPPWPSGVRSRRLVVDIVDNPHRAAPRPRPAGCPTVATAWLSAPSSTRGAVSTRCPSSGPASTRSSRSSSGLRSSSSSTKAVTSRLEDCSSLIACRNCGVITSDCDLPQVEARRHAHGERAPSGDQPRQEVVTS